MLGRTGGAKDLALPRLDHALQDLAALTGLRVRDTYTGDVESQLRVEVSVGVRELERALRDEAEPTPLEVRPQLKDLGQRFERPQVSLPRHDACVLVLNLAATLRKLAQDHQNRLQQVERLKARNHDRPAVVGGDELKRPRANHRADVARADEAIEA